MKNKKTKEDILKYIILVIIYILIFLLIFEVYSSKKTSSSETNNNNDTDATTLSTTPSIIQATTTTIETGIITETLTKNNNEIEYSYVKISNTTNNNLQIKINGKEADLNNYEISKEKFRKIDIKLQKDYFIVEMANENACKTSIYNLIIIDYEGKVLFKLEPKENDINFSQLKYSGNYKYNENENTIELEYILSCDMNCSICSTLDSQKNPLKDITSMTCEELDSAINNSAGKKTVKLTYENNQIIENLLTSEKLIDDTTGYSNNIKSKLLDFYKTKCPNE